MIFFCYIIQSVHFPEEIEINGKIALVSALTEPSQYLDEMQIFRHR